MSDSSGVLVVGAGPTGLTLAVELLSRGTSVRVVDRAERPHPHSRALVLWPRALEVLDRLGAGAALAGQSMPIHGQVYYSGGSRKARVDFERLAGSRFTSPVSIPQLETEKALRERFAEMGGQIEFGVELADLKDTGEKVEATLVSAGSDRAETVQTDWLVGCDGAHSKVRELIGVSFEGAPYEQKFVLADGACATSLAHDEAHHFMTDTGVLTVLGLPGGDYRVVASVAADMKIDDPVAFVQAAAAERCPVPLQLLGKQRTGDFRVQRRLAGAFKVGRVLILGDAAHVNSPVGAQGLNTGIEDAHGLGWRLTQVQRGIHSEEVLEEWAAERRHMAGIVVADTDRQTRMWMLTGRRATVRDLALAAAQRTGLLNRYMPARFAQLSNSYPSDGPGIGSLRAGMRLPDVRFEGGWLRDLLSPDDLLLLVLPADRRDPGRLASARRLVSRVQDHAASSPVGIRQVVLSRRAGATDPADSTGAAHSALGAREPSVILVRPDGIIALACRFDDPRIARRIRELAPARRTPQLSAGPV
ncbi:FAD-dependent monooxygenase [Kitasatospora sp. NPDC058397]|uniref:FAD-dependent monooxygenase n=1 Tax=unclassified Kitasatospora TaxID=2633591 RepID=UPI00364615BB